jgi:hypothetical protein
MNPHHEAASEAGADGVGQDIGALYEAHKDAMYGVARRMLRGHGASKSPPRRSSPSTFLLQMGRRLRCRAIVWLGCSSRD